ncbi:hypothetical protein D778_01470 [Xanthomarina gelatinilytica]|uniref:Uncharacterized protein n=1 Tax=Xanthomarina gelatinilytica TaxID=1137281 RepID=M7N418_9FLAO|nr:hypothetical protein D778_01470 [Xanthomarina gelatinilytica]
MDDKNKAEKTGCPALFDQVPYKKPPINRLQYQFVKQIRICFK